MKQFIQTTMFLVLGSFSALADDFVGKFQPAVEDQSTKKMVLRDDPIFISKADDILYRIENNEVEGIAYLDKASGVYRALTRYRSKPLDSSRPKIGPQYFEKNLVCHATFVPDGKGGFQVTNRFHDNGKEITTVFRLVKVN